MRRKRLASCSIWKKRTKIKKLASPHVLQYLSIGLKKKRIFPSPKSPPPLFFMPLPTSTPRTPRGLHRGPDRRGITPRELEVWKFMEKTQWLQSIASTASTHSLFLSDPVPSPSSLKKGRAELNPRCGAAGQVLWPYARLLERQFWLHPFTTGVHIFHNFAQIYENFWEKVAARFQREWLVPLGFHNPTCRIDSSSYSPYEKGNEKGWGPFIQVESLEDRAHKFQFVEIEKFLDKEKAMQKSENENQALTHILRYLQSIAESLGLTVEHPAMAWAAYNARPPQNSFIRVDRQWFGVEEEDEETSLQGLSCWESARRRLKVAAALQRREGFPVLSPFEARRGTPRGLRRGREDPRGHAVKLALVSRNNDARLSTGGSRWGGEPQRRPS